LLYLFHCSVQECHDLTSGTVDVGSKSIIAAKRNNDKVRSNAGTVFFEVAGEIKGRTFKVPKGIFPVIAPPSFYPFPSAGGESLVTPSAVALMAHSFEFIGSSRTIFADHGDSGISGKLKEAVEMERKGMLPGNIA
jgi:hypothetical protein